MSVTSVDTESTAGGGGRGNVRLENEIQSAEIHSPEDGLSKYTPSIKRTYVVEERMRGSWQISIP